MFAHSYLWHDSLSFFLFFSLICVTWLIAQKLLAGKVDFLKCLLFHGVWHDLSSYICDATPFYLCDVTPFHLCDMTPSSMVLTHIYNIYVYFMVCDTTCHTPWKSKHLRKSTFPANNFWAMSHVTHISEKKRKKEICVIQPHSSVTWLLFHMCDMTPFHMCDVTPFYMCDVTLFICVTWLLFMCVTWLPRVWYSLIYMIYMCIS